jgi:hypothetical protein
VTQVADNLFHFQASDQSKAEYKGAQQKGDEKSQRECKLDDGDPRTAAL